MARLTIVLWKNSSLLEEQARAQRGQNSSVNENCRTAEGGSRTVMRDNLKIAFPNDKYNGR
jgi:hypothetical protein